MLRSLALAGWTLHEAELLAGSAGEAIALEWLRSTRARGGRVVLGQAQAARRLERAWWLVVQDARWGEADTGSLREVERQVADLLLRDVVADPGSDIDDVEERARSRPGDRLAAGAW